MISPATHTAAQVIELLQLEPLPHEGGWFRRTLEAPAPADGGRRSWSMIHALFTPDGFSALHQLDADELWIFQAGDGLDTACFADGECSHVVLGSGVTAGQKMQVLMPAGAWQGARVVAGGRWTLVACVVVPEFRWQGFRLGDRRDFIARFGGSTDLIRRLTRG
jgi:predicted cupin superfamily sugar epimerase